MSFSLSDISYWSVADHADSVYSVSARAYVPLTDTAYQQWLNSGNFAPISAPTHAVLCNALNVSIIEAMEALEIKQNRAVREYLLTNSADAHQRLSDLDAQVSALRATLFK